MTNQTTFVKKSHSKNWSHIDAQGVSLGRLASRVAFRLMGKHKPTYTPHMDMGDHVVVTSANQVVLTGNKKMTKVYKHYTGYTRGLKVRHAKDLMESKPEEVIQLAVKRMLPKGQLGKKMMRNLHICSGTEHAYQAQKPETFSHEGVAR